MKTTEKQLLKKNLKRLGIFMLIVFLPVAFVCAGLLVAKVPMGWNIFTLVVLLFILYFVFLFVCDKMDRKKEERLKHKKDPFSD